ncbi:CBS domain-containing protein [Croceicoccus sp. F390]|uniref:CBS domain-containing protein n=1 Tax=Croceicoccus esteveae TaxID=3075597 RepID=A0ABU2ZHX8_9SPHN|nr:CBS domain-containing protein [Croceicoccus sp. F390]MDT0576205.1 CBS domain-containing protein [Croceicoccus sp. F390]
MTIQNIIAGRDFPVISCTSDLPVREAVALLADKRIGAMPVLDSKGAVLGLFSERDVIRCLKRNGNDTLDITVADAMTSPAITIPPASTVNEALALMTHRRVRHLPVVEAGRIVHFVSIGDLVKYKIDAIEGEARAMRDYIRSS